MNNLNTLNPKSKMGDLNRRRPKSVIPLLASGCRFVRGLWTHRIATHRVIKTVSMTLLVTAIGIGASCATLPKVKHDKYKFPVTEAFVGDAKRPYITLGLVRSKVNFQTMDPFNEEIDYCKNYYNKAVHDLVKIAHQKGGDAVIDVKSVVFFEDGTRKLYSTAECSDDGMEGQILTQGIAIQWKVEPHPSVSPKVDRK